MGRVKEIRRVGVVGCGLMGGGIAQVCAAAGYPTVVREVDDEMLGRGLGRIEAFLEKAVEKGKVDAEAAEATRDRLTGATELAELAGCDLIIEAIPEKLELKVRTFKELDAVCSEQAIFASNTSSLCITEMAVSTRRPQRFLGLHFFNPVPLMKLVEVVRTMLVDAEVLKLGKRFAESLGKTPVVARDRSGFIVNRLLVPYLLQAIRVLDEGLASAEDIDQAMQLGAGHPMGPLRLLDLVGLDTTLHIANIMYDEFKEPQFAPPPLLERMVLAGRHGRKSGRGFYSYQELTSEAP